MRGMRMVGPLLVLSLCMVSGCGSKTSGLSLQSFKEKLASVAIRPALGPNGEEMVILKEKLIEAVGQPMRVQQDEHGTLLVYYQIADGVVQIEAPAYFWNGTMKYSYLDSDPPKHPVMARLQSLALKNAADAPDWHSPEAEAVLAEWYLKDHKNKFTILGPDDKGKYSLQEDGKYASIDDPKAERNKSALEKEVQSRLANEARYALRKEVAENYAKFTKENTKSIDQPCLVVKGIRVY